MSYRTHQSNLLFLDVVFCDFTRVPIQALQLPNVDPNIPMNQALSHPNSAAQPRLSHHCGHQFDNLRKLIATNIVTQECVPIESSTDCTVSCGLITPFHSGVKYWSEGVIWKVEGVRMVWILLRESLSLVWLLRCYWDGGGYIDGHKEVE